MSIKLSFTSMYLFFVDEPGGQMSAGAPTPPPHSGALYRSERLAKYNQLLRIEEELGKSAKFAGEKSRNPLS